MVQKRKYSEALGRAVKKYTATHYDTGSVKLPKGTKEAILATGSTFNGFISEAVREKLENPTIKVPSIEDSPASDLSMTWYAVPTDLVKEMELYGDPSSIILDGIMAVLQDYRSGNR